MARSKKFSSKKIYDPTYGEFDSKTEYLYFLRLKELESQGMIFDLKRQEVFILTPPFKDTYGKTVLKMTYKSDFTYIKDGTKVICDVKGSLYNITQESKLKIKLCKYLNQDRRFEIMVNLDGEWYDLEDKIQKKEYIEKHKQKKKKKGVD